MFADWWYFLLTANSSDGIHPRLWYRPTVAGRVTVLLLLMAATAGPCAEQTLGDDLSVFRFTSESDTHMAPARLEGLMVSDGTRQRIAVYWMEPYVVRESSLFVCYADILFTPQAVHYWVSGEQEARTCSLTADPNGSLLPRNSSSESVVGSALRLLGHMRGATDLSSMSLEVGKFFQASYGRPAFEYKLSSDTADSAGRWPLNTADVQILNDLPFGREYAKERRSDRTTTWSIRRALTGQPLMALTVERVGDIDAESSAGMFDPATLGQWELIAEAYHVYWSFDRLSSELRESPDENAARKLYDEIGLYLDNNEMPAQVRRGIDRLRFKAALETGEVDCVWAAAQAAVAGLCADASVDPYQCLLELGSMSGRIDRQYPEKADERLRPLVAQTVRRVGPGIQHDLDRLMAAIERNRWFTYGGLVVDEILCQSLLDDDVLNPLKARLQASHLAGERQPFDPCEAIPSVSRYLAQIDADPLPGPIDMNGVRDILMNGLAKQYTEDRLEAKRATVENVIHLLRLIVGEGPFRGDPNRLTESIERFSHLYLSVDGRPEPINTVLATFLALSFCDISTSQDHDMLCSQFDEVSATLRSELWAMLKERGLTALVDADEVREAFGAYERIFRMHVDDPLCPQLKFPFTVGEKNRLLNVLRVRLTGLRSLLDTLSLQVRYGGPDADLKERVMREIYSAAEELLPRAVFMRNPSYRGISCRYRGGYGFVTVIEPLYREGDRPREKFKAMKYFHLGHRLEEVVTRERELARSAGQTP